ncbi:hypothetical protein PV325_006458 [Microctonus aethiopoides]|nr:hypothetical protein PV325_006458 [Microctonus aethiopoides]
MSKGMTKDTGCPLQWTEDSANVKIATQKRHLIHAAALYLVVVAILWCVPACLYYRISQTGQAVVLTLVDTTSAELQNLAEPHLSSDSRTQDTTKNLSQTSTKDIETDSIVTIATSSVPTVLLSTENINTTDSDEIKQIIEDIKNGSEENIVLVVRAEQKSIEDISKNTFDTIVDINDKITKSNEDSFKIDESISSSGEFDSETTRSKFITGSSEEAASVILDGVVSPGAVEHHEDIPSFSEWAQKRLEEAEKKKTHPNASIQNPGGLGRGAGGMKVRSKNYASPDCGAKIVAVNPEARSARSVLVSTRDEYMLNTCTSRIWFIVELCEAIQAKKIELANFELFSSSPKDISVFVSDRFPTRDWSAVGHFTAKDERDIQSFALHPHLFGKFIKIELHSHYGSEHFCPISLFRAYGTSEFEVLETETDVQETSNNDDDDDDDDNDNDDDDEETLDGDGGESSRNLFGSARDAVIRIVKKAAAVFVKTGNFDMNNITKIQESIEDNIKSSFANCMTPRYTILCNNCTDDHFAKVFHLLSCQTGHLDSIIKITFINQALHRSELCGIYGVDLKKNNKNLNNKKHSRCMKNLPGHFLSSVLPSEYIVALCNIIATKERKLVVNSSNEAVGNMSTDNTLIIDALGSKLDVIDSITMPQISATCVSDPANCITTVNSFRETKRHTHDGSVIKDEILNIGVRDIKLPNTMEHFKTTEILASQIKPTKTFTKEDLKRHTSVPILEPSKDTAEETIQSEAVTTPSPLLNSATVTIKVIEEPALVGTSIDTVTQTVLSQLNTDNNNENAAGIDIAAMKVNVEIQKSEVVGAIKNEEKEEKFKEKDNEDIKLTAQEQLSLESLLSDLKDLEVDSHGQSNSASTVAPLAASNTPQQKESVFLRLSNRIKALEQNMSLSGQYLEELSRRYKKQVEEMQRSLERATAAISEELKKSEERESKRLEEITTLREELSSLSESMEVLLYDRNSWKSKISTFGQHIALILIEITVLILIISYCRRSSDNIDNINKKSKRIINNEISRRKSAESMDSNLMNKNRKRRPSEIASGIMGTYGDLMIDDRSELFKERKKKRKRESTIGMTSNISVVKRDILDKINPSRCASSIDCPNERELEYYSKKWPNSAPNFSYPSPKRQLINKFINDNENNINCMTQNRIIIDEIDGNDDVPELIIDGINEHGMPTDINEFDKGISRSNSPRHLGFFKNTQLHSPFFIKTAMKSRSKRKSNGNDSQNEVINSESSECYSRTSGSSRSGQDSPSSLIFLESPNNDSQHNGETSTNGHYCVSDDSGSGNTTPTSGKKLKKEGSLRKMVRKLF